MSIEIRDSISPGLAKLAVKVKDKKPVLEAMGLAMASLTKRAFTDESVRPAPWAPLKPATLKRKQGRGSILRLTGTLWHSIRIQSITSNTVTVATDRPYAAAQQLGSDTKSIPPRPFFPFTKDGKITALGRKKVEAAAKRKIDAMMPK